MSMRAAYAPLAGSIRIEPAVSFFSSSYLGQYCPELDEISAERWRDLAECRLICSETVQYKPIDAQAAI
jgi:hypothetical protein